MKREHAEEFTGALGQIVAGSWRQIALARELGVPKALGLTTEEWVRDRLGGYVRLSIGERREAVAELAEKGLSNVAAAEVLGVDEGTVREDKKATSGNSESDASGQAETKVEDSENSEPPTPAVTPELPAGQYRCVVIDPPWPVQKIVREVRPKQTAHLDYPTMTLAEIEATVGEVVGAQDNCHVYLWVTQRFMPDGLRLLEAWGVKYQCQMTWVKNVGPTPFSWMYDTEHVLFGQRGSVRLVEKGLRLSFQAKVDGHSRKPAVFYQRVLAASPGPRLSMFERDSRDGFEVWGDEVS